ncbi:MAG: Crp/Fnr family transcriptional regulator [Clostridia bacterium]|nr:Crp/Fnr family transcriptional regulator [Clostridia bacterium]
MKQDGLFVRLSAHRLFAGMSEEDFSRALIMLDAHRRAYARGEYLHRMGEPLSAFGMVLLGTVQVYSDDPDGRGMMMANVAEGGSFGESLAFLAVPRAPVHILTTTGCEVLWLRTASLRTPSSDPFVFLLRDRFTAMLATRTLEMNDRIQILSKLTLRDKLTTFFTEWERRTGSRTFTVPFDRAALSDYLGTNRTALSRELSNMQNEGLIEYYKNSFKLLC